MSPAIRKFLGSVAIVGWLLAYVGVAAVLGDRVLHEGWWVQVLFFPIVGIGWIFPLRPVMNWMHAKDAPHESPDV